MRLLEVVRGLHQRLSKIESALALATREGKMKLKAEDKAFKARQFDLVEWLRGKS